MKKQILIPMTLAFFFLIGEVFAGNGMMNRVLVNSNPMLNLEMYQHQPDSSSMKTHPNMKGKNMKKKAEVVRQSDIQTLHLNVEGMTCSACNRNVENAAYQVHGVLNAKADYRTGKAVVKFDKSKTSADEIIKSIDATSYKVVGKPLGN